MFAGLGGLSNGVIYSNLFPYFVVDSSDYTAESYHLSSWYVYAVNASYTVYLSLGFC